MVRRNTLVRHAIVALGFALAYVLLSQPEVIGLSRLGLTTWYPAIGLVLAVLLAVSPWYAVAVCVADVLSSVLIYHQPLLCFTTTAGTLGMAGSYTVAARLLRTSLKIDPKLRKRQDIVRYLSVTSCAAIASGIIGVACLAADHSIGWDQYWSSLPPWFLGDEIGLLAVAPFCLLYIFPWVRRHVLGVDDGAATKQNPGSNVLTGWMTLEAAAQALSLLAVLWVMFGAKFSRFEFYFLSYIPIIWIAMRHGIRRVVIGILALDCGVVVALHFAPLTRHLLFKSILLMFVVSATGLLVGAAVSERHRIALHLHEQSTYLNSLIRNSPLGIVVLDPHGRIELTNEAFGKLFLYEPSELIDRDLRDIFWTGMEAEEGYQLPELSLGRQNTQQTVQRRRRDGEIVHLEVNTVPVVADDAVRGAFTIYKDISAQIRAAERERQHAESLSQLISELEMHTREMTLLNEMGNLLACCSDVQEATAIISQSVRKLFPDAISGNIYMYKSSRNVLEAAGSWGQSATSEAVLPPEACWGLRRGQAHWSGGGADEIKCSHLLQPFSGYSLCVPLVAQGDTLGILQLHFAADTSDEANIENLQNPRQMLATTVVAQIALSLANLRLRETLRDQSIRDPLTGLFNRRFLQESLSRELDRARRRKTNLSLLFVDLDHFKRFNDTFGHDAGDVVLRSLADLLRSYFRSDDIVCRYGGEEFAFVLPESSSEDSARRANDLRNRVRQMKLEYKGELLGTITLSVGVATFPEHGVLAEQLLKAADECLYQSKAAGRDRVTVATPLKRSSAASIRS